MNDAKGLIKKYVAKSSLMQLATVRDDRPWVCSVYYVVDSKLNLYWLSYPSRRHSQDIAHNANVAVTIAVKQDMPVVGVQAEGRATMVKNVALVAKIMPLYIKKYGVGKNFLKNFSLGTNRHALYCFEPSRFVLFDEATFGHDNSQELHMQ